MLVNPDFSQRAAVTADQHRWWASPQPGVERVMLDRLGGERGRATSLVRYAPGSVFPAHAHPGGEEILVLDGTFSDGSGHHGPGCYLRNPPGSAHQPFSADGALIFVKLWQMPADDTATVRINTGDATAWQVEGTHEVCRLHRTDQEHVSLLRLPPGHVLQPDARGGAELLVIAGQLVESALDDAAKGSLQSPTALGPLGWLRLAPREACRLRAGESGATLYLKTGHLAGLSA